MPADPPPPGPPTAERCPGCGAVLAPLTVDRPTHPGAAPSCTRLFAVTLHGLREEAGADPAAAAAVRLADAAYDAQHPVAGDDERLRAALDGLAGTGARAADAGTPPAVWRTTIADVAADLDVIDLPVLVESWARSVGEDWTAAGAARR